MKKKTYIEKLNENFYCTKCDSNCSESMQTYTKTCAESNREKRVRE